MNQQAGIERPSARIPSDYGNPLEEYDAIESAAGVIRLPDASILSIRGKNAEQFLNGLVSNDLKSLETGEGTLAAFLDVAGKVQSLARIYKAAVQDSFEFLLELESINADRIFHNLSRFVLAGEFFVENLSASRASISIQGPKSSAFLSHMCAEEMPSADYSHKVVTIRNTSVRVALHGRCSPQGFDIFVPADQAENVWDAILEASEKHKRGVMPIGRNVFDMSRIEHGIPKEPEDITPENILNETGLEAAVSYTKGCYLGQEIVARIHWRGQPARRLSGLTIETKDERELPAPGTTLVTTEDRKAGHLTSITRSLALNRTIALGYVHKYHLTAGTRLILKDSDRIVGEAEVVTLPFLSK